MATQDIPRGATNGTSALHVHGSMEEGSSLQALGDQLGSCKLNWL